MGVGAAEGLEVRKIGLSSYARDSLTRWMQKMGKQEAFVAYGPPRLGKNTSGKMIEVKPALHARAKRLHVKWYKRVLFRKKLRMERREVDILTHKG